MDRAGAGAIPFDADRIATLIGEPANTLGSWAKENQGAFAIE